MPTVLIAEDDLPMRRGIAMALAHDHFEVVETDHGDEIPNLVAEKRPDIVLLDVGLKGTDGFRICRRLRKAGCAAPVIFLTGRVEEEDRLRGLKLGDDYLTKPFSLRELQARIDIQLRHCAHYNPGRRLRFGDVEIDFQKLTATRCGKQLDLTAREFAMLEYFAEHESKAVTRADLLESVWNLKRDTKTRTVDMHIMKLREKIEADPKRPLFIKRVWGSGYKFIRQPGADSFYKV